jgi:hypothetical protein
VEKLGILSDDASPKKEAGHPARRRVLWSLVKKENYLYQKALGENYYVK